MAQNFVNIEDILDEVELLETESGFNASGRRRYQLKSMAIRGVRKMRMKSARSVRSEEFNVSLDKSILLPDDYLDFVAIYAFDANNYLVPLYLNKRISISMEPILDNFGDPIRDNNDQVIYSNGSRSGTESSGGILGAGRTDAVGYRSSLSTDALYGAGGGRNKYGYYKVDYQNNTIVLDISDNVDRVVMDYVTDSVNSRHEVVIPYELREAMYSWIMWKSIEHQKGVAMNEKMRAKKEFYNELRLGKRALTPFILSEYKQQSNKNTNQSVKF